jgi:hypothetical protein
MQGALLRSGRSESFTALGETGQPVYRAALQLREAIRRKSATIVDHLAIPQSNELGNIDWYSPIEGDVIPWSAATEAERTPARAQLEILKTALDELSARFLAADGDQPLGDKAVFGKLLKRVIHFPDQDFVYLVNGTPVLTFWGFENANADRSLSPLHCLYPPAAPAAPILEPVAPIAPPPLPPVVEVVRRPAWWRRWWWLLPLLLLLLLLLLFGLRSCAPNVAIPGLSALPGFDLPKVPVIEVPRANVDVGNGVALDNSAPAVPAGGVPALAGPAAADPAAAPAPAAAPPAAEPAVTSAPTPEAPAPDPAPTPPTLPAPAPAAPGAAAPVANQPLSIPADASNGVADFLNGQWRAGAGIQDRRTGKPLRLEYQFKNGQGDVTVHRADGVACSGPVAAAMNAGSLSIDSKGQAACADGSNYDMPKITCKQGAQTAADCTGGYANEQFPLSMRQTGE